MKLPREYRRRKSEGRKQREAAPPSRWIRSSSGMPAKLVKTAGVNEADEWLYRLDYGDIIGNQLWSLTDLEKTGVTFLDDQPADWQLGEWRSRTPEQDPELEA